MRSRKIEKWYASFCDVRYWNGEKIGVGMLLLIQSSQEITVCIYGEVGEVRVVGGISLNEDVRDG